MRLRSFFLCFAASALALAACGGDDTRDAGADAPAMDLVGDETPVDLGRTDLGLDGGARDGALLPHCIDTEPLGTPDLPRVASTLVATVMPTVGPLGISGDLDPTTEDGEASYASMGLGVVMAGPPQDRVVLTTLGGAPPTTATRRSLAYFVALSDFQLVDDESPTRLASLRVATTNGPLRSQEAYVTRAISAMSRTLARIEPADRPYDFGIITGDCTDSAQSNELDWVVQVMNGATGIETDSGDDDDPIPGPGNDPKDPFDATPFPAPWLFVPGNHDLEVVGTTMIGASERARATGGSATTGTRDYRRWYAPVVRGAVPADARRALVDRASIAARLAADTTATPGPPGHGFAAGADTTLGASYVYDAIPGLLRIIALDTSDDSGGSPGLVHQATVDGFLAPALDQAEADHVLVVLASHHATPEIDTRGGELGSTVPDAVTGAALEQLVASHANVVAWLVGHVHDHRIRAVAGPDATHPGYWEIMTTAIADWPSQARVLELVDNGDGNLSVLATLVDYDTGLCMERRFRRLSVMEWQAGWRFDPTHRAEDQNVELLWPYPAALGGAIAAATGHDRIDSETTLRGL